MLENKNRFRSSRIVSGNYDPRALVLELLFPDGTVVEYLGVPPGVWRELTEAASPGRFLRDVLESYAYRTVSGR